MIRAGCLGLGGQREEPKQSERPDRTNPDCGSAHAPSSVPLIAQWCDADPMAYGKKLNATGKKLGEIGRPKCDTAPARCSRGCVQSKG